VALPGGFVETTDATCESAAAREFEEETGIAVEVAGITPTHSFCDGVHLILFMRSARILSQEDALRDFRPSAESTAIVFAYEPRTLIFPSHTAALASYLARQRPAWPA
jgi:ADP-ribose pyrophosphatase YjhB (NUDIX family)